MEQNKQIHTLDFLSHAVEQTHRAGAFLATLLQAGDIVWLEGDLGAGKTTLTKGIADGLGVSGYVNSPTFTLVNEYKGRLPIYHLDCYRLESGEAALNIGLDEYLAGDAVTIIEWPERIANVLPPERLSIILSYKSETERLIRLQPFGSRYVNLLQELKKTPLEQHDFSSR